MQATPGAGLAPPSPARDFDEFYAACSSRLVGQLFLLTGDREEARDCIQEALERAWLRWPKIQELGQPEAWVRTVAYRLAVSRWRRVRNARTAWVRQRGRDDDQPDHAGASHDRAVIIEALQILPPAQRRAIVLHHLCDLSIAEIAAETGLNPNAIKSQLTRGRRAMGEHLGVSYSDGVPGGGPSAAAAGRAGRGD